jgi:MFS family permease
MSWREDDDDTPAPDDDDEGMGTSPEIRRSDRLARGEGPALGDGVAVYAEYVEAELEAQDKRKSSFEQRGLAVITTSGTLVTLLFALAALSTKQADTFTLPGAAKAWLAAALVLLFLSALCALATNAPLPYDALIATDVRKRMDDPRFAKDYKKATRDVALTRLKELKSAKRLNGIKGWLLAAAMGCQALGIGCVGVAVLIIIL